MDTSKFTSLTELFRQLGLPSSPAAIAEFISSHRLQPGQPIDQAPFWSKAQAAFLREALASDAEWAVEVDELAASLEK